MRKLPIFIAVIVAVIVSSCGKTSPEYANYIPDDAFAVLSYHPKQIYDKGQMNTFESLKSEIDNEILAQIFDDPMKSGILIDEYMYTFVFLMNNDPFIGTVAGLKSKDDFKKQFTALADKEITFQEEGEYDIFAEDHSEAGIILSDDMLIVLVSPEVKPDAEAWKAELTKLMTLEKEEAISSLTNFKSFTANMKDFNAWISSNEIEKLLEATGAMKDMPMNMPFNLNNNYSQIFCDFQDGAAYLNSEVFLSDDVEAAKDMLIGKETLNKALLEVAPGNDLLLALAYSVDIDKLQKLMKGMLPPEASEGFGQIEQATGVPGNEIVDALSGDIVIAVNGATEGAAIPVEVLIGIGLDDESLQEKLMKTAEGMVPVEKDGDFFSINMQGVEIYSGIVDGIWVITNAAGYKDAMVNGGLEKTLNDSKFKEYAGGSVGMYMNLDLTTYPAALQGMLAQSGAPEVLELLTESLSFMGMEASNTKSEAILKTAKENENSLYTLLKLAESMD